MMTECQKEGSSGHKGPKFTKLIKEQIANHNTLLSYLIEQHFFESLHFFTFFLSFLKQNE